jgi:hypothetical protein
VGPTNRQAVWRIAPLALGALLGVAGAVLAAAAPAGDAGAKPAAIAIAPPGDVAATPAPVSPAAGSEGGSESAAATAAVTAVPAAETEESEDSDSAAALAGADSESGAGLAAPYAAVGDRAAALPVPSEATSPTPPAALSSPSLANGGMLYSLLGSMALYEPAGAAEPWSVLPRTSEVALTRAYVSGYGGRPGEAFFGPGASGDPGTFRIDGFEVGDAASPGVPVDPAMTTAQQVQVTTGGADVAALSPGLQINLVERRGTNEWRASVRGSDSGGPLAARASRVRDLAPGQEAAEAVSGDRVRSTHALGAEVGGPLARDRLWIWSGLDDEGSTLDAFGGQPVSGSGQAEAAKLDARPAAANSATLSWNHAGRANRGEGAGPDRAPETTLDRHAHDEVWRLSDTAILSPTVYVDATAGSVAAAARDTPGTIKKPLFIDARGVAHGGWYADDDQRSTRAALLQVSASGQLGGAAHELKLAGEWRQSQDEDRWRAPDWAQITAGPVLSLPQGVDGLSLWRDGNTRDHLRRQGVWLAATSSWSRVTTNLGLRYDLQTPRNLASSTPGVPGEPLLPRVNFAGNDAGGIRWQSLTPRLALAWEPGGPRGLLVRASLARYAAQLSGAIPARLDPAAPASAGYYLDAEYPGDPDASRSFWYPNGFDPTLPAAVPANRLDPRLRPEMTDEAILGGEYALPGEGAVGLVLVYRRVTGVLEDRLLVRDGATGAVTTATASDWVPAGMASGSLPDGSAYQVPFFDLRPGLTPTGGTLLVNGDRRQQLLGATLEWHQRLARGWTARGHFTLQSWTWKLGPEYERYADPTPQLIDGSYDGQPVAGQLVPGGRPLYLTSPWSFDLSSAVQLPGHLNATAVVNGRRGLPLAYYRTVARDSAGPVDLRLGERADAFRSDDVVSLSARLDRDLNLGADLGATVSLEALNLLATGQVLRRETNLGVGRANYVDEVVVPRLLRLALRLQFR